MGCRGEHPAAARAAAGVHDGRAGPGPAAAWAGAAGAHARALPSAADRRQRSPGLARGAPQACSLSRISLLFLFVMQAPSFWPLHILESDDLHCAMPPVHRPGSLYNSNASFQRYQDWQGYDGWCAEVKGGCPPRRAVRGTSSHWSDLVLMSSSQWPDLTLTPGSGSRACVWEKPSLLCWTPSSLPSSQTWERQSSQPQKPGIPPAPAPAAQLSQPQRLMSSRLPKCMLLFLE